MLDLGKVVAARLREAISQLQAKIANGTIHMDGATSMEVAQMIDSAEKQIADIERKDEAGRAKEREEDVRHLAIAYKVEQEAALNAAERRQYGEFLKKKFFTKADFESLEKFYTDSYDKLTDGGKAEMSTRVWEGVRRKEYEFIELPDIVKEKEAQRLHEVFSASRKLPSELLRIPEQDRGDFVREWDAGDKQASYEVLNRRSFAENVSLSARSVRPVKAVGAEPQHKEEIRKTTPADVAKEAQDATMGATDFSLGDLQLVNDADVSTGTPLPATKSGGLSKGS